MDSTSSEAGGAGAYARLEIVLVQQVGGAAEDEGRRILVEAPLTLGRANPLFGEHYRALSRQHAELVPERDRLRLRDLGSRHGVFVNGRRVERATVAEGDVLALGPVSFCVVRAPRLWVPQPHPRLAFASYAFGRVLEEVAAARRSRRPICIVGEPGVGKTALAEEILDAEGEPDTEPSLWDLAETSTPPGAARAIVVDRLDEAPAEAQRGLLAWLRRAERERSAHRVVVLSCVAPEVLARTNRLIEALASWLDAWVVHVPPLRARPEDVLPLVRARLASLSGGEPLEIDGRLFLRLYSEKWRGNARALLAEVERLWLRCATTTLEDHPVELGPSTWTASGARRVAADGSWIEGPDGARQSIEKRKVLRAVLGALIDARTQRRGAPLTPQDVARVAWPGERIAPRALANRVCVAMNSLRNLGLGPCVEHTADGYVLSEDVSVALSPADASSASGGR